MKPKDTDTPGSRHALLRIKRLHTAIWAIFVSAILAIPVAALLGAFRAAFWLSALVWLEVLVLLANGLRCPLTAVAARHTQDRAANFDIFLPEPLARHNKLIFGILFGAGELFFLWRWLGP
ncbi:MAG TPA: hypothetical protein VGC36_17060 [Rhizomicrobium sp.]